MLNLLHTNTFTHSHSNTFTHTHVVSLLHMLSHTHSVPLSVSLTQKSSLCLSLTHKLTRNITLTRSLSLTHSLPLFVTYSHTLSLFVSLSLSSIFICLTFMSQFGKSQKFLRRPNPFHFLAGHLFSFLFASDGFSISTLIGVTLHTISLL